MANYIIEPRSNDFWGVHLWGSMEMWYPQTTSKYLYGIYWYQKKLAPQFKPFKLVSIALQQNQKLNILQTEWNLKAMIISNAKTKNLNAILSNQKKTNTFSTWFFKKTNGQLDICNQVYS